MTDDGVLKLTAIRATVTQDYPLKDLAAKLKYPDLPWSTPNDTDEEAESKLRKGTKVVVDGGVVQPLDPDDPKSWDVALRVRGPETSTEDTDAKERKQTTTKGR